MLPGLPDPLHAAVVHLPMALAVLLPLLTVLALIAIHVHFLSIRAWLVIVLLQALLAGSAWFALETGEEQEERVERVVAEQYIKEHEKQAERFLTTAVVALVVSGAGLLPAGAGRLGRGATLVASFVVLVAGIEVGHLGGELVFKHGAAAAYVNRSKATSPHATEGSREIHEDEDD